MGFPEPIRGAAAAVPGLLMAVLSVRDYRPNEHLNNYNQCGR